MKKPTTYLFTLLASLSLASSPAWAQAPEKLQSKAAPAVEMAPNVKNFRALQKLDRQIVALSAQGQPATVCLLAQNGRGSGSGVVVSEDGLILTAAHVTSSMPGDIIVIFPDGTRKTGRTLGADYERDAAMVQIIEDGKYPFVKMGQSKDLKRNEWTIALGHSGGFDPMRKPPVRLGRVLANRGFIVTDTAVIGGDSGGPLFDVAGEVIGIHSNIGASLMENRHVPIEVYRKDWEALKSGKNTGGRFKKAQAQAPAPPSPDQPILGIQLGQGEDGVIVGEVVPASPAEKAGLIAGDLVKKINGKEVKSPDELVALVKALKGGDEVKVDFLREGEAKSAKATLTTYGDLMKAAESDQKEEKKEPKEEPKKQPKKEPKKDAKAKLDQLVDDLMDGKGDSDDSSEITPKELKELGGMGERAEADPSALLDKLLADAAKGGAQLQMTPELLEKLGGLEKLMEELAKRGLAVPQAGGPDEFFASSLKALEPVIEKNAGSTALVLIDGQPVALGTVVSANGRILTKNTETETGKLSVSLAGKTYEAKVLKRFPQRDLALLKIEASKLRAVRFQVEEPPLGSILTASGAMGEPLGIGLLSVSGRALANVGFIGIQAGKADEGVLIDRIVPKGAAAEAGLQDKDVMTRFDGEKISDPIAFGTLVRGRRAGEEIEVEYLRDGKSRKATVTLKERAIRDGAQNDPRMKRTLGRLSSRTTGYPDAIQHDIPLPPELCGGPLFNLKGKCIGVNVSRAGRTKTYAIPADEIVALLKAKPAKPPVAQKKSPETREAIKAIRASLKQIEQRLNELEAAGQ